MKKDSAIEVNILVKKYRLGTIGMSSLREELSVLWNKKNKDIDNNSKIGNSDNTQLKNNNVFCALDNISFSVKKGDIVGIVGANGSGKSTLLKILSRITEPTKGEVKIRGKVASLLEVGTGFHPELTGRENVYINGAILGMTRKDVDERFDKIIEFSGVKDFINTPIKRYSSGMTVRLGFAVAAHLDPDILIVDEVLAVGDINFQNQCIQKMKSIAESGKTILFVSHNNHLLRKLCNKGILLKKGCIAKQGNINEVLDYYSKDEVTGISEEGKINWKDLDNAPGDTRLRLRCVKIKEVGECNESESLRIDRDFEVVIQYENLKKNNKYLVSLHLLDANQNLLLAGGNLESYSMQKDPFCLSPLKTGIFETTCRFPGKLFNAGEYSLKLYITTDHLHDPVIAGLKVLDFRITETDYMRDDYSGVHLGTLKFKQSWATRLVS